MNIIERNKKLYLKNLNMFIVRQIYCKINTNFLSITVISIMLFVTICVLSSGVGINTALNKGSNLKTPYDLEITSIPDSDNKMNYLKDKGIDLTQYINSYVDYNRYSTNVKLTDIIGNEGLEHLNKDDRQFAKVAKIYAIKLSDYNKLMKLKNKNTIELDENEFIIITSDENAEIALNYVLKDGLTIDINNKQYNSKYKKAAMENIRNISTIDLAQIIINDSEVNGLKEQAGSIVFDVNEKFTPQVSNDIKKKLQILNEEEDYENAYLLINKDEVQVQSLTTFTFVAYIGIYVGIILILTSGAILAIQQLSEDSDNKHRYTLLRKIGTNNNIINKALFIQIASYFFIPLSVAIINSIVGLKAANDIIKEFGGTSMVNNIIFSAIIIGLTYGMYFVITYLGAKSTICENK